jgi:hypothetical protein
MKLSSIMRSNTNPAEMAMTGREVERSSTGMSGAFALVISALREIFDESAYARFLNRSQLTSSREAYAAFRKEYEVAKARRPRCC